MTGMIHEFSFTFGYSKVRIKSDKREAVLEAVREVRHHISELLRYVKRRPIFQCTLEPIDVEPDAPLVVQVMAEAARIAGVGPMASVGGAIADLGLRRLLKEGANIAIVEDGGEIAAYTSEREITVSILTGEPGLSGKMGLLITGGDSPLGIGTSTGRTIRTISFGEADSVTVVADNAAIADAAATSICNAVTGLDIEGSIRKGLERSKRIKGVRGAIIVRGGKIGLAGKLPRIIKIGE